MGDLPGDPDGLTPPSGEESRESLVCGWLEADGKEAILEPLGQVGEVEAIGFRIADCGSRIGRHAATIRRMDREQFKKRTEADGLQVKMRGTRASAGHAHAD